MPSNYKSDMLPNFLRIQYLANCLHRLPSSADTATPHSMCQMPASCSPQTPQKPHSDFSLKDHVPSFICRSSGICSLYGSNIYNLQGVRVQGSGIVIPNLLFRNREEKLGYYPGLYVEMISSCKTYISRAIGPLSEARTAIRHYHPYQHYHSIVALIVIMVSFNSLLLGFFATAGVLASPRDLMLPRSGTPSSTGTSGGFYYSFWTSGTADVIYTNGADGAYTVDWDGSGDFVAGKGWNPGSAQ